MRVCKRAKIEKGVRVCYCERGVFVSKRESVRGVCACVKGSECLRVCATMGRHTF